MKKSEVKKLLKDKRINRLLYDEMMKLAEDDAKISEAEEDII